MLINQCIRLYNDKCYNLRVLNQNIVRLKNVSKIFFYFILILVLIPFKHLCSQILLSLLCIPFFQLGRQTSSCLESIRSLSFHKWIPVAATEASGERSLSLANYKLIKLTTFLSLCYVFRGTFEISFVAFSNYKSNI